MENERDLRTDVETKKAPVRGTWTAPMVLSLIFALAGTGVLVWFSLRNPNVANNLKDLVEILLLLPLVAIGFVLIIAAVHGTETIRNFLENLSGYLSKADVEIKNIAPLVDDFLNKLAAPMLESKSKAAGILSALRGIKNKE